MPLAQTNRTYLNLASRQAHDVAEALWFNSGSLARADTYWRWLLRMLLVHETLALPSAQARGDKQLIEAEHARIYALRKDLGLREHRAKTFKVEVDFAWGVGYAVNGSSLGASIIMKSGQITEAMPSAYLLQMQAYARSGALAEFFRQLNALDANRAVMARGAQSVFSLLSDAAQNAVDASMSAQLGQGEMTTQASPKQRVWLEERSEG